MISGSMASVEGNLGLYFILHLSLFLLRVREGGGEIRGKKLQACLLSWWVFHDYKTPSVMEGALAGYL